MTANEPGELLRRGLEAAELNLPETALPRLERYLQELLKWRGRVNLISRTAPLEEVVEKHFIDSLTLLPLLQPDNHLVDIGTGAGFPGLVCRAAMAELELTLVEPRRKRINFLRHVSRSLRLSGDTAPLVIHEMRLETESDRARIDPEGSATHLTCRAVSEIASFLQLVAPFAAAGVTLLLMKGPRWEEELTAARDLMARQQLELAGVREVRLPFCGAERFILSIRTAGGEGGANNLKPEYRG